MTYFVMKMYDRIIVTALEYRCFVGDKVVAVNAMKEYEEVEA